ncbi:unnamed protein product [Lampetra fluviatilis]
MSRASGRPLRLGLLLLQQLPSGVTARGHLGGTASAPCCPRRLRSAQRQPRSPDSLPALQTPFFLSFFGPPARGRPLRNTLLPAPGSEFDSEVGATLGKPKFKPPPRPSPSTPPLPGA